MLVIGEQQLHRPACLEVMQWEGDRLTVPLREHEINLQRIFGGIAGQETQGLRKEISPIT